jgi:hypothetical protein
LFGLNNWVDGSWEQGSLVVRTGNVYRARTAILPGDLAPDSTPLLPAGTVIPSTGVQLINDVPGVQIDNQNDLERLCITQAHPAQWMAYPVGTTFTINGAPGGFFDGENLQVGDRMVWTGFPNMTVGDQNGDPWIVNGWMRDPGTTTAPGGGQAVTINPSMINVIRQVNPTSKWDRVPISGALKFIGDETGLPGAGKFGDNYLILVSPTYGSGNPVIVTWDSATTAWVPVGGSGGGGNPMNLMAANQIVGVGCPIGTIIMWASTVIPPGWLELNGQQFDPTQYPELGVLFPGNKLPDLRNNFVRMWGPGHPLNLQKQQWTTGRPRKALLTSADGQHEHTYYSGYGSTAGINGGNWHAGEIGWGIHQNVTDRQGEHHHTITGGGDAETAPDHVILGMLIKATDNTTRLRP